MNATVYQAWLSTKAFVDIKITIKKHGEEGTAQFNFTTKETKFNCFDQNTCLVTFSCSFYPLCSLETGHPAP